MKGQEGCFLPLPLLCIGWYAVPRPGHISESSCVIPSSTLQLFLLLYHLMYFRGSWAINWSSFHWASGRVCCSQKLISTRGFCIATEAVWMLPKQFYLMVLIRLCWRVVTWRIMMRRWRWVQTSAESGKDVCLWFPVVCGQVAVFQPCQWSCSANLFLSNRRTLLQLFLVAWQIWLKHLGQCSHSTSEEMVAMASCWKMHVSSRHMGVYKGCDATPL